VEIIPNWLNGANLTQTTVRISIDSLKAVNKFCKYQLQSSFGKVQVSKYLKGAAQPGLNCGDVENFYLALPSKKEQQAIAQALFETDELLQKLDEFIIKKKNLKKGAMQELLTGKKRLKGFTEEWEETILGDVSDIKTGGKNNEDKVDDGKYPFFVRSQTVEKINSYSYDGEAILIPGEGGIGSIFHYINGKFDVHQRVYKISNFSKKILGKLVYYYMLQNFNKHAMKNSVKATVDSLRLPTFQEFKMHLPKDEKEQQAITEVMDNLNLEIQELEQKKDKYKMIKEGMMQQLLTGKIRLKWEK
jgi:type I restriction enzyme S subunit